MESQISVSAAAAPDDAWSKLPADLLGEVYGRIVSLLDRVRFTAVCRTWRVMKSWQQPAPTFPWLTFSSCQGSAMRVFCPVDGASLRIPLPLEVLNRVVGFHDGGWIATTSFRRGTSFCRGGDSLAIVNLFSGVEAPLSAKQRNAPTILKLVCSERPTLNRCILAAILMDGFAVCKVGCRNHNWWRSREGKRYDDIAFYDGKFCGLLRGNLFIYNISMTRKSNLVVSRTYMLDVNQLPKCVGSDIGYIFKHGHKLLMAKRAQWSLENRLFFKVFELIKNTQYGYSWVEVTTLNDHALFLSTNCSKMVYVSAGSRGGVERNHIYYNHINLTGDGMSTSKDVQLTRYNDEYLYCRMHTKINGKDRIKSIGYYMSSCHYKGMMWLLPPDF